ncbi:MAG: hypothetical protein C0506_01365 [Anaerolinea sp.]|nr:hypothetical protein [Anaerolinea sp.]
MAQVRDFVADGCGARLLCARRGSGGEPSATWMFHVKHWRTLAGAAGRGLLRSVRWRIGCASAVVFHVKQVSGARVGGFALV